MLALKLIVFVLIVCHSVLGRDTRRGNVRYKQTEEDYKYHHPPAPENYEAIPVAVVYDDVDREDKSIKNITPRNDVEQVNKDKPKPESSILKLTSKFEVTNNKHNDTKLDEFEKDLKATTYRPQKEQQIPVAVVYEPESSYYQKPRQNGNRTPNKRRKIQRPAVEEKQIAVENDGRSNVLVNGHTGSLSIVGKQENLDKRRRIQRPVPDEKRTNIEEAISSNTQANQFTPTIRTDDKTKELNNRVTTQRPLTEEQQPTFEENISLRAQENEESKGVFPTSSKPTVDQPEKHKGGPTIHWTVQENKQMHIEDNTKTSVQENENISYDPTTKNPEEYNSRQTFQRPDAEKNENLTEDIYNSRVRGNENIRKPEQFSDRNEGTQQFSTRGDSFRVREVVPIVQSKNVVYGQSGAFQYSYEGGDGTKAFENGELRTFDDESAGEAVSGGFSYTAKDGNEYSLSYTADENGYRPVGAHLPTPPPIPPAIARALAHLATKTTPEPITQSIADYDQ